jgi:peptidoglycan-associated lipoprotein
MNHSFRPSAPLIVLASMLLLTACSGKKMAKVTPPSAPPPVAPTAALAANPNVVQQGQATALTWRTTSATDITIEGLGGVPASGSRSITPGSSQTYTLVAKGAGGTAEASARVTVNPAAAQVAPASPSDIDSFTRGLKDVFFDFNAANIRPDEAPVTKDDASLLAQHSGVNILIEGHCDERGSEEYNLALGESRANSVKASLIRQGVDASRIKTVSYGKEKPFCTQESEECWQQNRRDHLVVQH